MAAYGWRKDHSVEEWLLEESYQFDFFQAVRLLQMEHLDRDDKFSVGESTEPDDEIVRFGSAVDAVFPASDIAGITFTEENDLVKMSVNFLTLAGVSGSLPAPHTELILERDFHGDHALREFLDIFNHRLVSLLYRIRKTHRIGLDHKTPGQDAVSEYLYSLIGLGTPNLRTQMEAKKKSLKPRSLLHYAGLLAQQPRSLIGLEVLLADYFQMPGKDGSKPLPVKGVQFRGQWFDLDDTQLTRIGASAAGQNQCLGRDTVVLGRRVWDQQARFELRLGPLPFSRFVDFLPIGKAFRELCELTRFYADIDLEFTVRLVLKGDQAPPITDAPENSPLRLGQENGPRLGWTSWLKSKNWQVGEDDEQVKIALHFTQLDDDDPCAQEIETTCTNTNRS